MGTYTSTRQILSLALTSTLLAACGYGSSGTPHRQQHRQRHRKRRPHHADRAERTAPAPAAPTRAPAVTRERGPAGAAGGGAVTGTGGVSSTGTGGGRGGTGGSVVTGAGGSAGTAGTGGTTRHRRHHRQRRQHRPFGLGDPGCGRSVGDRSHGHGHRQHRHHGRGDRPQVRGLQLRKDAHHERIADQLQQEVDRALQAAWHPDRQAGRQRRGSVELWRDGKRSVESAGAALHPHHRQRDDRPVLRVPAGDGVAVHLRRQLPVRQRLAVDGRGHVRHEQVRLQHLGHRARQRDRQVRFLVRPETEVGDPGHVLDRTFRAYRSLERLRSGAPPAASPLHSPRTRRPSSATSCASSRTTITTPVPIPATRLRRRCRI